MKALLTLILASGIYCRSLKSVNQHQQQQQLLKLSDELQEAKAFNRGNDYYGNSIFNDNIDEDLSSDLVQRLYQYYLAIQERMNAKPDLKLSRLDKAVYLFIKTMKQRNKRQNKTKYLTLCHFKICNIGGKRNARYVHMSKLAYDDRNT